MPIFNEASLDVLQASLTGLDRRHKAISNNLANVDTPGYKREEVNFKNELEKMLAQKSNGLSQTNNKHFTTKTRDLASFEPTISREMTTSNRIDKNNVDIDAEMSNLAKTDLKYQAMTNLVRNRFDKLGTVIDKGGR